MEPTTDLDTIKSCMHHLRLGRRQVRLCNKHMALNHLDAIGKIMLLWISRLLEMTLDFP